MKMTIHTDGGARGNPGPAAVGVVIADERGKELKAFGKRIGETTNNVAEYTAVIEALRSIEGLGVDQVEFFLDSTLVVNQLNGVFKVKDAKLQQLLLVVRTLEQTVKGSVRYAAVRREKNTRADFLVNKALDTV